MQKMSCGRFPVCVLSVSFAVVPLRRHVTPSSTTENSQKMAVKVNIVSLILAFLNGSFQAANGGAMRGAGMEYTFLLATSSLNFRGFAAHSILAHPKPPA